MLDLIGHIGYASIAAGMFLLSKKNKVGWVYRFLGESIWVGLGFYIGMTSIWGWGIAFMFIDWLGYMNWKEEEQIKRIILNVHN